jgi:enoyl-CoA hydratase/carnithine racemase
MPFENIVFEQADGVAVITLNRPGVLNALSMPLMAELDDAIARCDADEEVRAVIVTGAGEKAFSAGADIHEMAGMAQEELDQRQTRRGEITWRLATSKKPLIGALNGLTYGGAAVLASTFDIRIGCERTKFRFLAASYGRINSTWSLPVLVGMPMAKELLFSGRVVEADEAKAIGLLNRVVPSAELLTATRELAGQIAKNTPAMVQGIKELLNDGIGASLEERLRMERDLLAGRLKPAHPREGFKDFLSRKPKSQAAPRR